MKKTISLCIAVMVLFSTLITANAVQTKQTSSDKSTNKEYSKGDIITVDFLLGNVDAVGSISAKLFYDTNYLEIKSMNSTEIKGSVIPVLLNEKIDGEINIGAVFDPKGTTNQFSGDKISFCTFTFAALKDYNIDDLNIYHYVTKLAQITDNGSKTQIIVDKIENEDYYTGLDINIDINISTDSDTERDTDTSTDKTTDTDNLENPEKPLKIGDVDGDDKITSADSLSALRYSVKLETYTTAQVTAADVNKDNKVDSSDALSILRKSVGLTDNGTYFDN